MTWIVVAIAQLVVGWLALLYQPVFSFMTVDNYDLIAAVWAAIFVWLTGLVLSFVLKGTARPIIMSLLATVAIAVLVGAFINFENRFGLTPLLNYLPYWGRPGLILLCAVAAYWAVSDLTKLPFNPVVVPSFVVGVFSAVLGAYVGGGLLLAIAPAGTYPRILVALPLLVGGLIGLVLGAGLVVGIVTLFRRVGRH